MNYQKTLSVLFDNSCLAMCYAYCAAQLTHKSTYVIELGKNVLDGVKKGYIDIDGYVRNPNGYLKDLGISNPNVHKEKIMSLAQLPDYNVPVEYVYGTTTHFVVANNKGLVWDPYENSNTFKNGHPISYRMW